ncbi:MAG: hypothetical protein AAGI08_00210 [Bacteroidota bacterium]
MLFKRLIPASAIETALSGCAPEETDYNALAIEASAAVLQDVGRESFGLVRQEDFVPAPGNRAAWLLHWPLHQAVEDAPQETDAGPVPVTRTDVRWSLPKAGGQLVSVTLGDAQYSPASAITYYAGYASSDVTLEDLNAELFACYPEWGAVQLTKLPATTPDDLARVVVDYACGLWQERNTQLWALSSTSKRLDSGGSPTTVTRRLRENWRDAVLASAAHYRR